MSNKQIIHGNHAGVEFAVVGDEVRASVPANTVMVVYDAGWPVSRPTAEHVIASGGTSAPSWLTSDDEWLGNLGGSTDALTEVVSGGAGFVNVNGAVTLNLADARAFHHTMTGNITGLSFANVPDADTTSAAWTWVLRINATGGYTLAGTPTVTFVDGRSFSDLDLSANAENIVTFWRVGAITYASLLTNGELAYDPYKVCFLANGTIVVITEAESIDVANATAHGTGTVAYQKNGATITTRTTFAVGDRLGIVCTGISGSISVRVPRYAL